ncbi:MAG: ribosomal protein S18-alanine N-acetyltransferase [Gammaproteobacteria bacterium]|nr:ribosomal protein S18-alanine N-acetyltransferase [Gammaproteobacteria bacterium]
MKYAEPSYHRMGTGDIDTVMLVEKQIYEYPWTENIFNDCIRAGYECWLACIEDEVVGYAAISIAAGESHILNISVAMAWQGQGIGKHFIGFLIDIAKSKKAEVIMLEVRPSNVQAINCYSATGFNEIGCRKDYYPAAKGREDALLFARDIG